MSDHTPQAKQSQEPTAFQRLISKFFDQASRDCKSLKILKFEDCLSPKERELFDSLTTHCFNAMVISILKFSEEETATRETVSDYITECCSAAQRIALEMIMERRLLLETAFEFQAKPSNEEATA
jgi:hypothetical protein